MKSTYISREENDVKFSMEYSAEELEDAQIEVYKKEKDKYQVDGFRPGKAPRKMIEQRYGENVFIEDGVDNLLQTGYPTALNELEIEPIDSPKVEFSQIKKGEGFTATITVAVPPVVEAKDYVGIKIKDVPALVSDEDIEKELETMQGRNARQVEIDGEATSGDTVTIDYSGFVGDDQFEGGTAEGQNLKLGSGSFIPGFEEQLIGKKKGDAVDVEVTFPEEYHSEELAGKAAVFKVTVHEVRREEKPEIDDEFAKEASEFDTLAELKEDLKKELAKAKEAASENEKKNAVLEGLYDANPLEVPPIMVEDQMDNMMNELSSQMKMQGLDINQYLQYIGQEPTAFRESTREEAEKRVKIRLLIQAVAKQEGYTASEEEVDTELTQMGTQYGMEKDKIREYIGEGQVALIKEDIRNRKAVDYLYETAVVEAE